MVDKIFNLWYYNICPENQKGILNEKDKVIVIVVIDRRV